MTVRQAFEHEQPQLLALPDNPFPTDEHLAVRVGKTPYIRFDLNDYSVAHTYVQRTVTVIASLTRVRIVAGTQLIGDHARVYAKGEQIEDPAHIDALVRIKNQARQHRGQDRLTHSAPASVELLQRAAERGLRLRTVVSLLLTLLDEYGARELQYAIAEALARQVPHPNAVRQVLERRREQRHLPAPIAITLPDNAKAKHIVVRPASLARYDQLDSDNDVTDVDTTADNTKPLEDTDEHNE